MMKKRMFAWMLTLLMLVLCVVPASAAGNDFNRQVADSVVMIYTEIVLDGELLGIATGTGFFIGTPGTNPEYLITNYHVIDGYVSTGGGTGQSSLMAVYEHNDLVEAYVVDFDQEKDIALLHVAEPATQRGALRLCPPDETFVGASVFAVGYPGAADDLDAVKYFGKGDATVTSGSISRLLRESGTGTQLIQTDTLIYPGNSGGPLVDTAGDVIGINTFIHAEAEGVNYAVNIAEVIPMLERNNVTYVLPKEGPSLLLIGGIALAVIAIVVLVVLLVVSSKKKKKNQQQPVYGQPQQARPQGRPVLSSQAPQHRGQCVPVGPQTMIIGRDPGSCQFVYANNTPGVSSRHCSLAWDAANGDFLLTDMNSTYGTFLANGQKLSPGAVYRLRPGDSFYLGDPANVIRVELV